MHQEKSSIKPGMMKRSSKSDLDPDSTFYRPEFKIKESSEQVNSHLWELMSSYAPRDKKSIQSAVIAHSEYTLAKTRFDIHNAECYKATALTVRDRLIESWNDTQQIITAQNPKRVYYFSIEYLLGRLLKNALINLNLEEEYRSGLNELGFKLEDIYEEEPEPGLGNGGLGRLAACFLDSIATMNLPGWGYGIRYNYGIFKQNIVNGAQVEVPDFWLVNGNPWEIQRTDVKYAIRFYGHVKREMKNDKEFKTWEGGEIIYAVAFDNPIPGYDTFNTINLRLWKSEPTTEFDFASFNHGEYFKALESRQRAEYISSVLYPNDSTIAGKELRLKQEYFFVSASLQDIIRRFKKANEDWNLLPQKVAVQLNDTHPTLSIVELLRILIDEENLEVGQAWILTYQVFSYTNHTVLPEALEKWSVDLIGSVLPRHLELIYMVNFFFLDKITKKFPGDVSKLASLSIIEESTPKMIRMAHLAIVGSHAVNGVAKIHSELLKTSLFKDFYAIFSSKFQNKTNGVTPRRWIVGCNPDLAKFYTESLEDDSWKLNIEMLEFLNSKVEDPAFQKSWGEIKLKNKIRLKEYIRTKLKLVINENTLFDVMTKRIHEYKRQLMNALFIIHRYLELKDLSPELQKKIVPRTVIFAGKAAPGYTNAKRIIKLIGGIQTVVNSDDEVSQMLKVVFIPNYNVSMAEIIIPAADLSQHISTAGTEASGTSNMKFCMNGSLIIGTMDGANVEIAEEIGVDNMFIFGAKVNEIDKLRSNMRNMEPDTYVGSKLKKVFRVIEEGMFGYQDELIALINSIRQKNDFYLVCQDFEDYCRAQNEVDRLYANKTEWIKKSIKTALNMSNFSSDRTIEEYSSQIWKIEPVSIPMPPTMPYQRMKTCPIKKSFF